MRGRKQDRSARTVIAGHALVQNLRRGHYELAVEEPVTRRVAVAFDELALVILTPAAVASSACCGTHQTQQCPWGHRTNEDESRLCRALGFGKGRTAASTATFLKCGAHALFGSLPVRAQWPGSEAAGPTACCQRVSSATVTARYPEIRWVTASAWSTGRL